ncbi:MAG: ABC transporter permease [Gemmatimonadetes bacterium]|nr:ABC transporter permease [Gemmatimonadota bacterium]
MRLPFRLPASRGQITRDLDDELALHASLHEEALVRRGMDREAARVEAARRFGDAERVRAECLAIDEAHLAISTRRRMFDEFRQDLHIAWRSLARDRALLATTLLVITLGIGASTAVFSLYQAVVLRPLAVAHPERTLWVTVASSTGQDGVSPAIAHAWRDGSRALERLVTSRSVAMTLTDEGEPLRVEGLQVGRGFFEALGLGTAPGRGLGEADYTPGAQAAVVISRALWLDRLAGDPRVEGRTIRLDGRMHTIVGVLDGAVEGQGVQPQFLVADPLPDGLRDNFTPFLATIGLLRPGASVGQAEAELQGILERTASAAGRDLEGRRALVRRLGDHISEPFRFQLLLLLGAVLTVLLIANVNVSSLLLARGAGRGREFAVRASLGASRGRLVRQLFTEHLLLAVMGGVAGLLLALWGGRALVAIMPPELPRLADVRLDGYSVLFAAGATLATAVLAGLLPALRASRVNLGGMLQEGGRGSTGGVATERTRQLFVVSEIALSAVLLVSAALLLRSAQVAGRVSPGFAVDSVHTARYALPAREYPGAEAVIAAHERILASLRGDEPTGVALASAIPLGDGGGGSDFRVVGGTAGGSTSPDINAQLRFVSPGYLRTMGIDLIAGRDLDVGDGPQAPRRLLVSETLARRLGLGDDAVGRQLGGTSSPFMDSTGTPYPWEIVGVVREPRDAGLRAEPSPQVFIPLSQTPPEVFDWSARSVHVVWRQDVGRRTLAGVSRAVHAVDPGLPLFDVRSMRERLRDAVALERASTALLTALGLAAALLAAAGLHGVVSYHVRQREREFGVRMALGARPGDILHLVVRWGGWLTLAGLVVGVPLAITGARALRSLLFGVSPWDAVTILGVSSLLVLATTLACLVPAWRASKVPPDRAIRR